MSVQASARDEVAVASVPESHIELIEMGRRVQCLAELPGLIVVTRSRHVAVDLLEADDVWVFGLDDLDDPLEAVTAITTADPFMDVIAQ